MAKKDPKKASPKSDERNVVDAEKVNIQDIEDRIVMIWEKNKGLIVGGIALLFVAFIGYQGFKLYQRKAEASLKEGYQQADTPSAKLEWAKEESGTALSGFAFKELGDTAYAEGDLEAAATRYREAIKGATGPVENAARIALAVTLIEQGNTPEAKSLLRELADDEEAANRAEAQYRLARLAKAEGDIETAKSLVDAIPSSAIFWKSRARALDLPESEA